MKDEVLARRTSLISICFYGPNQTSRIGKNTQHFTVIEICFVMEVSNLAKGFKPALVCLYEI